MQNHKQIVGTNGLRGVGNTVEQPRTDIHDVLRTPRRWFAIEYLATLNTEVTFNDLLAHVCQRVYGSDLDSISTTERKRVRNSLYQTHIPRLKKEDIADYDRETGIIRPGPRLADAVECMEGCEIGRGPITRIKRRISLLFA